MKLQKPGDCEHLFNMLLSILLGKDLEEDSLGHLVAFGCHGSCTIQHSHQLCKGSASPHAL